MTTVVASAVPTSQVPMKICHLSTSVRVQSPALASHSSSTLSSFSTDKAKFQRTSFLGTNQNQSVGWCGLHQPIRHRQEKIIASSLGQKITSLGRIGQVKTTLVSDTWQKRTNVRAEVGQAGASKDGAVEDVVIVGGGVAGLATALALHRVGLRAVVLEQADGIREGGSALSLWGNGWRALDALGVGEKLRQCYQPLTRVELCSSKGRRLKDFAIQDCVEGPHEVRGVHRRTLLTTLADELPPGTIWFSSKPAGVRQGTQPGTTTVELEDGTRVTSRILLGCDGTRSAVAKWLDLGPTRYCGYAAYRGLAEYPDGHQLGESIRMVMGQGVRAGMYPLTNTDVYWFTCFNAPEDEGRQLEAAGQSKQAAALATVKGWAMGVEDAINRSQESGISRSNITDRWTLPFLTNRWGRGGVSVLGDAAHPMTPNLGQGACTALEDAVILAREIASVCTVESVDSSRYGGPEFGVSTSDGVSMGRELGGADTSKKTTVGVAVAEGSMVAGRKRVLGNAKAIEQTLERFEKERIRRTTPITIRSFAIGAALQLPFAPVRFMRDNVVIPKVIGAKGFLNHAEFDCGDLPLL